MGKRVMFKSMVVAVLAVGATFSTCAQSAHSGGQQNRQQQPSKASQDAVVTAMGKGATKEEAKLAAFRDAVEKAVGVWVDAESLMENDELLKDRVNTISNADIKRYETKKEWRLKSGQYGCQIKAWVEKKAIAPKFASVFPAAFANVGEAAQTIHVQKVTKAKRSEDAAALMTSALKDVDRMRNWVRLSVVKGKALEKGKKEIDEVKKIGRYDVNEVPDKGLYSVRYSMKIDDNAYFKGFLPHFKTVLRKMQEGEAEEDVLLTSEPIHDSYNPRRETCDGRKLVANIEDSSPSDMPPDLSPFISISYDCVTYSVDPVALSGFPETDDGVHGIHGSGGGNPPHFMFDEFGGLSKVQKERTFNIWLLDRMNKDKTSIRCSAYKVPAGALRAYWKSLYGELDSSYVIRDGYGRIEKELSKPQQVEIVLLDESGEEITARIDSISPMVLTCGGSNISRFIVWPRCNVFNSFFVRPLFAVGASYSTEIQRDVYFPLTDAQLEKVKQVKVRFVGGKRK